MNPQIFHPDPVLEHSPCGVLVLDQSGRIHWTNSALEKMLNLSNDQLLGASQEDPSLPPGLFDETRLIHIADAEEKNERWFQSQSQSIDASRGGGEIRYLQDITETVQLRHHNEQLQRQIEELAMSDELTGMANRRSLMRALNSQVARSRRYNNPLALAAVRISQNDGPPSDEQILSASRCLRDRLRWVDMIAHWEPGHFLVILPETTTEESQALMDKMHAYFDGLHTPTSSPTDPKLITGQVQWEKGLDPQKLVERALGTLESGMPQGTS